MAPLVDFQEGDYQLQLFTDSPLRGDEFPPRICAQEGVVVGIAGN